MIGASMLSPELQAFQADVHAAVKRLVTPGLLFALDRNEIPYPLDFIRAMGSLGLLGVNVRAESGGRGLTIQHDALISEEAGYWGTAAMACARTFTAHVGYVFRSEFVSNELGGSPVWGEALAADEPFHPSRQTVLTPSRPKHVPSERSDAPEHRP